MADDYIKRSDAINAYRTSRSKDNHKTTEGSLVHIQEHNHILHIIDKLPAADVVEVVRCKDCEYYEIGKSHTPYCNNVLNMFEEMKPDDFCSYGKRRTTE